MPLERQLPPITNDIYDNVGLTPMVRLRIVDSSKAHVFAKCEYLNPSGSIKDRVAKAILSSLEKTRSISQNTTLVIPTSGNFGISMALLSHKKNYKVICVIPERTSLDRVLILKSLGVEIIRTPSEALRDASESHFSVAKRLAEQLGDAITIDETTISAGAQCHEEDTAEEIFQQMEGNIDYVFVGMESAATVMGLAKGLKRKIPTLKVFGIEPQGSSIEKKGQSVSGWKIEDLGQTSRPPLFNEGLIDEIHKVEDTAGYGTARRLIRDESLLVGPSSGAAVHAAMSFSQGLSPQSTPPRIVVILNDTARNYISTLLSDEYLLANDLMDPLAAQTLEYLRSERYRAASVEDLQLPAAVTTSPKATLSHALDLMLDREFSHLPVISSKNRKLVGYISLAALKAHLEDGSASLNDPVDKWMFRFNRRQGSGHGQKYEVITPDTPLSQLAKFFEKNSFAVVTDDQRRWCLGVATKYDLITFLNRRNSFSGF